MNVTDNEKEWKRFYKAGGISVFLALAVMLTEMFLTALPDGARVEQSITGLFEMYDRNWFMAMRYMGLMNIFATTLMIPVYVSFYGLYRHKAGVLSFLALVLSLAAYAVFISDNVSFAFLELAGKYASAETESERTILVAAGEALFARGASHTPGTFPGFFIGQIAALIFSWIIMSGGILKKATGIIGLISFSLLLIFEIVSSFIESLFDEAMILAMTGGTLALIWYVMVGTGLFRQSRKTD